MATPCDNGGTCLETNNTRTCDCVAGYTGENCETGGEAAFGKTLCITYKAKLKKMY